MKRGKNINCVFKKLSQEKTMSTSIVSFFDVFKHLNQVKEDGLK